MSESTRPPLKRFGFVLRCVVLALSTGVLVWISWVYVSEPGSRDPRTGVFVFAFTVVATYAALSVLRYTLWGPLRSKAFRVLFAIVALVAGGTLPGPLEASARAREQALVAALLESFVVALRAEQQRSGSPPTEIVPLLRGNVASVPDGLRYLRFIFLYAPGHDRFAVAAGIVPRDRDDRAYALYSSSEASWRRLESKGSVTAQKALAADLAWASEAPLCRCQKRGDEPWVCGAPCGDDAALSPELSLFPAAPPPSSVVSPSPAIR